MKRRIRIKFLGKVIIAVIIIAIIATIVRFVAPTQFEKLNPVGVLTQVFQKQNENVSESESQTSPPQEKQEAQNVEEPQHEAITVKGMMNSFAGYTSAIVANGGLETAPGSYYDNLGIDVELQIEDEDENIIKAFKDGDIDFFFVTVNKMAFIAKELHDSGVDAVIPYLSDTSTGGDAIIAKNQYQGFESLKDAKIAMAENSVSSTIPVWLFNHTDLSEEEVKEIIENNFMQYPSTQEAVDAFVNGECDAVSTWDIGGALEADDSYVMFSTENAEYLVVDALVVSKEFAEKQPETVQKLIDGMINVVSDYNSNQNLPNAFETIRSSVPDFAECSDEELKGLIEDSKFLGYQRNVEVFDTAKAIYMDFSQIWEQFGYETNAEAVSEIFDVTYLNTLSNKWLGKEKLANVQTSVVANMGETEKAALISKTANVLFTSNSAEIAPETQDASFAELDEFTQTAKILNKMIIYVEGNVSLSPGTVTEPADVMLSQNRADEVKTQLILRGIEESRIVTLGHGGDKPRATNETPEGRKLNRYVMCSFYQKEED